MVEDDDTIILTLTTRDEWEAYGVDILEVISWTPEASDALAAVMAGYSAGQCWFHRHGRVEHTVQTKIGSKRLVKIVGVDKNAVDSGQTAAIFTIEGENSPFKNTPAGADKFKLRENVIARAIVAFRNGAFFMTRSPTLESILVRSDFHNNDLAVLVSGKSRSGS